VSPRNPDTKEELVVRPIGFIRTPFRERADAPRQPRAAEGVEGTIELLAGHDFEDALSDLAGWEYVWVLFWFHLNEDWRPKVLPPRSTRRRGVFSTRSPHRPNPIGQSALRLLGVEGLVVRVADVDLLDGTPILDIKPYVSWTDAIVDARAGWLDAEEACAEDRGERPPDPLGTFEVVFDEHARAQIQFLHRHDVDLEDRVKRVLSLGPQPHAYRRIRLGDDGTGTLAIKDWRIRFRSSGRRVEVLAIASGFSPKQVLEDEPGREVHRAFVAQFGGK